MSGHIEIIPYRSALASAFTQLNRAWIEQLFRMEEADEIALGDPEGQFIVPGGQIFFALDDDLPVGTVASALHAPGVYELAKMAVSPSHRGRGIGEMLGRAAVEYARSAGAAMIFIDTSSTLANAIRLYERLGFVRTTPPEPRAYARADVYLELHFTAR